jgi:peptide/nickel transport system permease protein
VGVRRPLVMWRHIVPDATPTIIVAATASISTAILTESALSFLGLGIQPPMASWGSLLETAQGALQTAPYLALIPGVLILLTVLSFNVLGDALRQTASEGGM